MNKGFIPFIGILVLLLALLFFWNDNHQMELELVKRDYQAEKQQEQQNYQDVLKKLQSFERENGLLKKQLEEFSVRVESAGNLLKEKKQPVVTSKVVKLKNSEALVQVELMEKQTQTVDSENSILNQKLKNAEMKILSLENKESEYALRLSSALRDESQIEDPFMKSMPTRSTIHDLVQQNVKEWLELGEFLKLSMDEKDALGRTPVHIAAELGLKDQLDVLYKFGNKIDSKDNFGKTPLQRAVESKSDSLVWFNGKGVNYDVKDKQGWKLIHHAAKVGNIFAAKFLKKNDVLLHEQAPGAITPLMIALAYQQIEMALWLLEDGSDVHARDDLGQSALHYVARFNTPDTLRLLAKYHPTVNSPDDNGRTPLHYAAILGRLDMVRALLDFGAIAVFKDNGHCSPIHHAAMGNHVNVVQELLEYGVHVDELDVVGRTPLHIAVVLGNVKLVNLLLSWGANVAMQDGTGQSPEQWAEKLKRHHITKLFEDL